MTLIHHKLVATATSLALPLSFIDRNADAVCPAAGGTLRTVHIGNSYTGGTSVGRACDRPAPENCRLLAVPGNVARAFYQNPPEQYPWIFDFPPDQDTLLNPAAEYDAITNPHRGDVPGKIKQLADKICFGGSIEYVQNSQSAFSTRVHARKSRKFGDLQDCTLHLLEAGQHDVVIVQPQSTEYLSGATSSKVSALMELLKRRQNANPGARYIVQQTWPKRDATTYNHICTTGEKKGIIEEIERTIKDLLDHPELQSLASTPFEVAPTGKAFVEFAKLACGSDILPFAKCAFDDSVYCPIWYGESNKVSLYEEDGTHQSDWIGAWLSATVLYGVIQSSKICYVSEAHVEDVMPAISPANLADIPTGLSIHHIISEAARMALVDTYGPDIKECAGPSDNQSTPNSSNSTTY